MTRDEIDKLFELMADEAAKGDPDAVPGALYLNSSTWMRLPSEIFPTTCTSPGRGIRYRGVRVLISSKYEDRIATRAECGEEGGPFEDLEPREA